MIIMVLLIIAMSTMLAIIGLSLVTLSNETDNHNLEYQAQKIIQTAISIEAANIVHEADLGTTAENIEDLVANGYLKESIENTNFLSDKSNTISFSEDYYTGEYLVTFGNSNKVTEELCEKIVKIISDVEGITLKNCDKEVTQLAIMYD